jgi:hypothetical protein
MGIDCANFPFTPATKPESVVVEIATGETRVRQGFARFRKGDEPSRAFDGTSKFRHLNTRGMFTKPIDVREEWAAS